MEVERLDLVGAGSGLEPGAWGEAAERGVEFGRVGRLGQVVLVHPVHRLVIPGVDLERWSLVG